MLFEAGMYSEVTHEGEYSAGIERLATLLVDHYGSELFPVVSVGNLDEMDFGLWRWDQTWKAINH